MSHSYSDIRTHFTVTAALSFLISFLLLIQKIKRFLVRVLPVSAIFTVGVEVSSLSTYHSSSEHMVSVLWAPGFSCVRGSLVFQVLFYSRYLFVTR